MQAALRRSQSSLPQMQGGACSASSLSIPRQGPCRSLMPAADIPILTAVSANSSCLLAMPQLHLLLHAKLPCAVHDVRYPVLT